ncbi:MAG TPA: hypothetical protein VF450_21420, partial [Noviherbaspirillum sp.]
LLLSVFGVVAKLAILPASLISIDPPRDFFCYRQAAPQTLVQEPIHFSNSLAMNNLNEPHASARRAAR